MIILSLGVEGYNENRYVRNIGSLALSKINFNVANMQPKLLVASLFEPAQFAGPCNS